MRKTNMITLIVKRIKIETILKAMKPHLRPLTHKQINSSCC